MDQNAFMHYLKKGGRSEEAIERIINYMGEYSSYLESDRGGIGPDEAGEEDLEAFVLSIEREPKQSANTHLWALCYYYNFTRNEKMQHRAGFLRQQRITRNPFKLKDFRDVNPDYITKLGDKGIRTTDQMLQAGATPVSREKLAEDTEIPVGGILEIVQLCDLSRIPGVKGIRAHLYHQAGAISIEAMAEYEPEQLLEVTRRYVQASGFEGIAPLPAEVRHAIMTAKKLPRTVQY